MEVTREQLKAMGLTDEQIDAYLGSANRDSGSNGLPFPVVKVNYDPEFGKLYNLVYNPQKDDSGELTGFEKEFDLPFKVVFLDSAFQYSKYDATQGKVTIQSNIFKSLSEAKNAYDIKTGVAIKELKDNEDGIKLQRISLVKIIDNDGNEYPAVWFIKGAYLYELNQIISQYSNEAHLTTILTLNHKRQKRGSVKYVVPELVGDEKYNSLENIKKDAELIAKFNEWIKSQSGEEQTANENQSNNENDVEENIEWE